VIVIDSSAVIAILRNEPTDKMLMIKIQQTESDRRFMSVVNYVEAGAVLAGHAKSDPASGIVKIDGFIAMASIRLALADEEQSRLALEARIKFGRGFGAAAGLNFGDCFAYALAKTLKAPLLFVGDDFTHTDIVAA
jgi:ribonuclease VapC